MKKLYFLLFFSLPFIFAAKAQQYGNEWINYGQKYYKFNIVNDGVYRIDSTTLANSGINLSLLDPHNFQLFGRGKEIPLYIKGDTDNVLNGNDFIEFYAQHNDGFLDSLLYDTAANPNPFYSLITDTASYFLTWNSSTNNLRYTVVDDTLFSQYTPVNYFLKDDVKFYIKDYRFGMTLPTGSTEPQYVQAEGWMDDIFAKGNSPSSSYTFNTANIFTAGPASKIEFTAVGASVDYDTIPYDHELKVEFRHASSAYVTLYDSIFLGYKQKHRAYTIASNNLGASTDIRFTSVNNILFSWNNYTAVGYTRIKFPHTINMENQSKFLFFLPDNPNTLEDSSLLDMSNFNSNASAVLLYDLTNHKRFYVYPNGGNFRVIVPNTFNEKKCYLTSQSQINNINSLQAVTPSAQFTDLSSLSFDSAFIIITHPSLMSAALAYKAHRISLAGGSHNVIIANVEELYDQFAYGIHKHPMAIKHFSKFALDTANISAPRNLFLMGKSIAAIECRTPVWSGSYATNFANCLVPTIGSPPTDNYFTAGLLGPNTTVQAIPTGRLAAKNVNDVTDYLNKVITYESNAPAEWMKHIIHFGGGTDATEQQLLANFLNNYKNIIENPSFGGVVHSFFKDNSQPINLTISDSVRLLINNGVSLMTFFGHASGNSFDQNIDYAYNYNNAGKYPLILANSCFTGDIHEPVGNSQSSTSEDWVLIPNKGSIGFIAAVSKSVSTYLDYYSSNLYTNLSLTNYNRSIGYCMQQSVATIQNPLDNLTTSTCLEMSLHGDPSIKMNTHALPDYAIDNSSIFFTPGTVTTATDSFNVSVVITNIGKAENDTVNVELKRTFPNGTTSTFTKSKTNIWYRDTVIFRLPVDNVFGPGLNKFEVRVDPFFAIPELSETNNDVTAPNYAYLMISSGDINPIYPYKYAIIPYDTVRLKASTSDPFAAPANYRFELDTTDRYNSPFIQFTVKNSPGGVIDWKPNIILTDSTVYYWRVKKDSTTPADSINHWREFSFQYISTKRGWEQAHFFQFKDDDLAFLDYNRNARSFDFITTGKTLFVDDYGQSLPSYNVTQLYATEFKLDLTIQDYAGCGLTPAMMVAIIDPITLQSWGKRWFDNVNNIMYNPTHNFGNANDLSACRNRVEDYFIFRYNNAAQLQGMRTMMRDSVPNGYYILMYTWLQGKFQSWADPSVEVYMRDSLGAHSITTLADTVPYIFFCQKGDTTTAIEVIGDSSDQYVHLTKNLTNNNDFGTIVSEIVGPAQTWDSLSWHTDHYDNFHDTISLDIIGINSAGIETNIRTALPIDSSNIFLHNINPVTYPYLKLKANLKDDSLHTAPQLKKWQVFYSPQPEVAVNPPIYFSFHSDTVQEGDSIKFKVAVTNVSEFDMDSMLVTYWIVDKNRVTHYLPSYLSKKLLADSSLITSTAFATLGYSGLNSVWMEINPLHQIKTRYEQYHFNNIAQVGFFVGSDHINPLLDVTFDGIHILNGDIVSAKPNILIKLKDENQFLALNDTADFKVYLKKPGQTIAQRIYFSWPTCSGPLCFTPAVLPNNSCILNYAPILPADGNYELIVQAQDRSANSSGHIDYHITFEIVNKPSITEVLNYPNPFSTSTKFVFTLTGSEIPDYIKIQIFTITGKVIREINKDELGPLHIGRNITEYAWNGRDDFGDQLANGVYLYRVMTQLNGSGLDIRNTEADQYFKKGFGKMYLMR